MTECSGISPDRGDPDDHLDTGCDRHPEHHADADRDCHADRRRHRSASILDTVLDCSDTSPVDGEGECTSGPATTSCSLASGHAQRGCINDGDCGGAVGSCQSTNRLCFLTGGFTGKKGTDTPIAPRTWRVRR